MICYENQAKNLKNYFDFNYRFFVRVETIEGKIAKLRTDDRKSINYESVASFLGIDEGDICSIEITKLH